MRIEMTGLTIIMIGKYTTNQKNYLKRYIFNYNK